ncbi:hypothetical protein [uncultured Sphingomonas sp.]|uniref:hypothetical protein n=1 Tax=uncultured Sphingomonas sp. TaxID=158754 RepID=UPI0025D4B5F8|nr:hypothetical protein [uncultured Sphingomonas sp.]
MDNKDSSQSAVGAEMERIFDGVPATAKDHGGPGPAARREQRARLGSSRPIVTALLGLLAVMAAGIALVLWAVRPPAYSDAPAQATHRIPAVRPAPIASPRPQAPPAATPEAVQAHRPSSPGAQPTERATTMPMGEGPATTRHTASKPEVPKPTGAKQASAKRAPAKQARTTGPRTSAPRRALAPQPFCRDRRTRARCLYRELRGADDRLRKAYDVAERRGVAVGEMRDVRRAWSRALRQSDDDPATVIRTLDGLTTRLYNAPRGEWRDDDE